MRLSFVRCHKVRQPVCLDSAIALVVFKCLIQRHISERQNFGSIGDQNRAGDLTLDAFQIDRIKSSNGVQLAATRLLE
jgi:hypothetical protein